MAAVPLPSKKVSVSIRAALPTLETRIAPPVLSTNSVPEIKDWSFSISSAAWSTPPAVSPTNEESSMVAE